MGLSYLEIPKTTSKVCVCVCICVCVYMYVTGGGQGGRGSQRYFINIMCFLQSLTHTIYLIIENI